MFKDFFNQSKKKKYLTIRDSKQNDVPTGIMAKCPSCKEVMYTRELNENLNICFNRDHHIALTVYKRIEAISDDGSFIGFDRGMTSADPLDFLGYEEKIEKDQQKAGLNRTLVSGTAELDGIQHGAAVMDTRFRMRSMGSVVGEEICRIIDHCTEHRLSFILSSASGGAKMREGIISLMQMGKTNVSLKRHSNVGLLYISYITNPTTEGVSANSASVGDIDLSRPKALIGFADRCVVEQIINKELSDDFQTTELLLEHGQLDKVTYRKGMCEALSDILRIHQGVSN